MVKYNLNGMLLLASALSFTACNDPVNGYFAPLQQDPSSSGSTSSVGPSGAPAAPANPGGSSSGGAKSPCTPQMATNLRIMLVVDASGSTISDDAGAKIRVGAMSNFINNNLTDANLTYSLTYFTAVSKEPSYDFSSNAFSTNASMAFGSASQALTAVTDFQNTFAKITGNGTDYEYALNAVTALVTADNAANPGKYSYVVVFMSDGEPNTGPDTSAALDPLVASLINLVGPARMTLSSVYFSNQPDTADENLIDKMALAGNGYYVNGDNMNLNLNSMIQGIITVPANACPATAGAAG